MIKRLLFKILLYGFVIVSILFFISSFKSGTKITEENYKTEFVKYLAKNAKSIIEGKTNIDVSDLPTGLVTDIKHVTNVGGNFEQKVITIKCESGNSYSFKFVLDKEGKIKSIKYIK